MKKLINLLMVSVVVISSLQAQPPDTLRKERLVPLAIGAGVVYAGTMAYLSDQWYSQYESQSFTFFNDAGEWKQMDKAGHMYGAYQLQRLGYQGLRWSGLQENKALLWSGITSFVFMTSIEVMDAYSAGYGASVTDAIANAAGIGLFTVQQLAWREVRIHAKYGFSRSGLAPQRPEVLGNGWHEELVKDYNAHTIWLSFDVHALTGRGKFPKWLNVAVGYGAHEMIYANDAANLEAGYSPYRQWYIGPDLDLSHIKTRSKFLNTLLFAVDMIRIPFPALEYGNDQWHWHWLK